MAESPGCCFVWARCFHCLYSCHWKKCPKDGMQTNKCECVWFGLLFLTFLLSLGWLYVVLILLNDLHNFNECVTDPLPQQTCPKILLLLLYFGATLGIYLAPLFISSACIMEPKDLPHKPKLIGHRGAPMLAPENTLMSLRKTAECGAVVFETDVMVSSDGIPFLMHDERLTRTTDVASVFPDRVNSHSSNFSWAELKRLNAGAWFLQTMTMLRHTPSPGPWPSSCTPSVVIHLRPCCQNPQAFSSFMLTYPEPQVLWLPDEDRAYVQERAPQMRQIYGHLEGHGTENPQFLNLPYQDLPLLDIKALHHDNVSVNLFVVNKPWLFSLLWCAGVDSVTTNDCQLLQQMRYPVWLIPARTYLIIWIVTNCVSILLLLWTFLLQQRPDAQPRSLYLPSPPD
ncbi:hypothetical protein MJG53_019768 [Ovis ammon polii x Ovis aries]|uniref:Uncharacterized protein n=1 Tax=Ovis ammon polii x Ovis aries TaxID=2918886 RepID=A0ACB9U1B1_9CETA|nr:hypothetical protein MJG53_019768 [Ovis ammon polii x Ovis aries]